MPAIASSAAMPVPARNFRVSIIFFIESLPFCFFGSVFVILVRTVTAIAVEGVDRHAGLGGSGLHRSLTDQNAVILDDDLRWCQGRSTLSRLCPFGRDEIADASLEFIGYRRIAFGLSHRRHDLL